MQIARNRVGQHSLRFILVSALVALVLTGCAGALPAVDWCYRYDFRNSNYGFTVLRGVWSPGAGFVTEGDGRLHVTYTHSTSLTPTAIIVKVARGIGASGVPISVTAEADIFGLGTPNGYTTSVPADVTDADIYLVNPSRFEAGPYNKLEIKGITSHQAELAMLEVRGNGSNPFGSSNCSTDAVNEAGDERPVNLSVPEGINEALVEADSQLAAVDVNLAAPGGIGIVPALTNAAVAFGYIKWVLSGTASQELAGPFAPVLNALGIYLIMSFSLTAVQFVIYGAIYIVRWIIWLLKTAQSIMVVIAAIIGSLSSFGILLLILLLIAGVVLLYLVLTGGLNDIVQAVQDFLPG